MGIRIITTEDGSHSLLDEELNETYHSTRGARGESMHVFIKNGLEAFYKAYQAHPIRVLEVGMGTGLNVLLSLIFANEKKTDVSLTSLEPFPIAKSIFEKLNYATTEHERSWFGQIHACDWEKQVTLTDFFQLTKHQIRLEDYPLKQKFHVIYFDAFAPSKQSEVWSLANLQKCFSMLENNGILTTYCAQGQFKRNLREVGFMIETLQGAMGKKEMVVAIKE
ncbi:MAG: tRNA (5-methylaminomethyl-2-thiouridine)(34)-methyltransferase MnmD [Bacteroidota bacterium]